MNICTCLIAANVSVVPTIFALVLMCPLSWPFWWLVGISGIVWVLVFSLMVFLMIRAKSHD